MTDHAGGYGFVHGAGLRLAPWLTSLIVWLALWGEVSVANLASGALLATAISVLTHPADRDRLGRLHPIRSVTFLGFMAWNLVKSTALVAREVLVPHTRIEEGILAIPLPPDVTPAMQTVITTAIGLTPGTVVVEIDAQHDVQYVHVFDVRSVETVRADLILLQRLALRAFGPDEADDWNPSPVTAENQIREGHDQ